MRVLIAAVSAASELSGVQRHAFSVTSCLLTLPEITRVELIVAPWQVKMTSSHAPVDPERVRIHVERLRNTALARNAWFYNRLPSLARSLNVDLVHASYPVPLRREAFHCPVVVTLHDLYPYEAPRNFGVMKAWLNRRVLQECLRSVNQIACVSGATIAALKTHTAPNVWRKASRIYNSVEITAGDPQPPANLIPADVHFLLCVAQHRHNKNIALVLRSFHRLLQRRTIDATVRLLVVGIRGPETPRIQQLIEQLGLRGLVVLAEGLSEEELLWCYKQCLALVMPSLTEGFGLPAVEALLAGCKVICSDIPALREVGGKHCQFVSLAGDPVAQLADEIEATLRRPMAAPISLPQFATTQIAQEYSVFYRDVMTQAGRIVASQVLTPISNSTVSERSPL
jgi:glycosyltransferase involved in cell wall biosynthesis